jgi:hypothetical protein
MEKIRPKSGFGLGLPPLAGMPIMSKRASRPPLPGTLKTSESVAEMRVRKVPQQNNFMNATQD